MIHQHQFGFLNIPTWAILTGSLIAIAFVLLAVFIVAKYGSLWFQARMSNTDVSIASLIGMSFRNVKAERIVEAQVMASQAGLTIAEGRGMRTAALEAHYLAGGDVEEVVLAVIAANRAGIDLDFDRAAAIDLSGRDLAEAVRTSVFPKVIDVPDPNAPESPDSLSAIAKNGIELLTRVRVTVRTNLDQLIGGATEETIVARVGQGIVSTIGSMDSHKEALAMPSKISEAVLDQGIETNTAYKIVSIDIASIDVGRNIGARLQSERAESDTRVARASAEVRKADATALLAEMTASVKAKQAEFFLAEASSQSALAKAFRDGQFYRCDEDSTDPSKTLKFPGSREIA